MRQRRWRLLALPALLVGGAIAAVLLLGDNDRRTRSTPGAFELVGHDPLRGRGMNSALALHGDYAYVGSRSDGSHEHGGILVVRIADPPRPRVVAEVGPPAASNPGETSRELRVWTSRDLLITLNLGCDSAARCRERAVRPSFRFLDLRADRARSPRLIATYGAPPSAHEFFLWIDPENPARALLYVSVKPGIVVLDISRARIGRVAEIARWRVPMRSSDVHSVSVSPDGRRAYVAALGDGVIVLDTSSVAAADAAPVIEELTTPRSRPSWGAPGAHSAIPIPGRDLLLTTDEVYGSAADPDGGCPWGWARLLEARDEGAPKVHSEYRVDPWNVTCTGDPSGLGGNRDLFASFSSHNPTATRELALVSWHSAGLQAIGLENEGAPRQLAEFIPEPLAEVATEDPVLTDGPEKVAMWSYPIVRDGLIYVADIRNGLYVLRYRGPHAQAVGGIGFLEGNSNAARKRTP